MDSSYFHEQENHPLFSNYPPHLITGLPAPVTSFVDLTPSPSSFFSSSSHCSTPITPASYRSAEDGYCHPATWQAHHYSQQQQQNSVPHQFSNHAVLSSFASQPMQPSEQGWINTPWEANMPLRSIMPQSSYDMSSYVNCPADVSPARTSGIQNVMPMSIQHDTSLVSLPSEWSLLDEDFAGGNVATAHVPICHTIPGLADNSSHVIDNQWTTRPETPICFNFNSVDSSPLRRDTIAPSEICMQSSDDRGEPSKAETALPCSNNAHNMVFFTGTAAEGSSTEPSKMTASRRLNVRRPKRALRAKSEEAKSEASTAEESTAEESNGEDPIMKWAIPDKDNKFIRCGWDGCGVRFLRGEHFKRHFGTVHMEGARLQCPLREHGGSDWCNITPQDAKFEDDDDAKPSNGKGKKKAGISRQDNRLQHMCSHCWAGGRNSTCQPAFMEFLIRELEFDTSEKRTANLYAGVERQINASASQLLDRLKYGAVQKRRVFEISNEVTELQRQHPYWEEYQRSYVAWRLNPDEQTWQYSDWDALFDRQAVLRTMSAFELEHLIEKNKLLSKRKVKSGDKTSVREYVRRRRTARL